MYCANNLTWLGELITRRRQFFFNIGSNVIAQATANKPKHNNNMFTSISTNLHVDYNKCVNLFVSPFNLLV